MALKKKYAVVKGDDIEWGVKVDPDAREAIELRKEYGNKGISKEKTMRHIGEIDIEEFKYNINLRLWLETADNDYLRKFLNGEGSDYRTVEGFIGKPAPRFEYAMTEEIKEKIKAGEEAWLLEQQQAK